MDLAWSAADLEFRDEVRDFLDEHLTEDLRQAGRLMTSVYADHEASMAWHAEAVGGSDRSAEAARTRLLAYNEDDVRATAAVRSWMRALEP